MALVFHVIIFSIIFVDYVLARQVINNELAPGICLGKQLVSVLFDPYKFG
jgi:hypothetical protein